LDVALALQKIIGVDPPGLGREELGMIGLGPGRSRG
jgi:hypothetical protein